MKKGKLKKIVAMAMASVLLMTGCGEKGNGKPQINIGYFNNVTHPQALYMKANQSLEKAYGEEISVSWTAFNAGPAEVEALFSGDIDIGYIGPVPAVTANVKSQGDVVVLAGATKGGAVMVKRKDSDVESVADLAGKNVAIPQIGNTQHLSLLDLLSSNGLKTVTEGGDVTVSAVANADVANTMERGDIDAALVPEPWGATLLEGNAEMLLDYDQIYLEGKYDVAVVVVRKEFQQEHPELVEEFVKQHELVTKAINDNKEAALKIINKELEATSGKSLSDSVIVEAFTRIGVSTDLNKESIIGFANISKEQGIIKEVPAEENLYAK